MKRVQELAVIPRVVDAYYFKQNLKAARKYIGAMPADSKRSKGDGLLAFLGSLLYLCIGP